MKAQFCVAGRDHKHNIVFIEDIANHTGGMTITNDAEAVFAHWTHISGPGVRVVYRDTDGEWWEIFRIVKRSSETVGFRPWHGLVWDKLSRIEQ
jgi:hypothetical protein